MKTNYLVFGGNGKFGSYLKKKIKAIYFNKKIINDKKKLIKSKNEIEKIIIKKKINCIINLIAITDINHCNKFEDKAKFVNSEIANFLSKIAKENQIKFIFFSTDQIFDNFKKNTEKTKTKSINIYSRTKITAEKFIKKNCSNYLILRTNFLSIFHKKKTIYDKIYNSLKCNKKILLWDNILFTPLHPFVIIKIIKKLISLNKTGIYNLSSNKSISKFQVGILMSKYLKMENKFKKSKVQKNFIRRSKSMILDNKKIKRIVKAEFIFDLNYNLKLFFKEIKQRKY